MANKELTIAIAVFLVIIIIYYNAKIYTIQSSQMEGLWMAPDTFCKESDIDGMIIYIGPVLKGGFIMPEKRKACLIIHAEGAAVAYKKLELSISSISGVTRIKDDTDESADVDNLIMDEFDDASTVPLNKILPDTVTIAMNLKTGNMTWTGKPISDDDDAETVTYADLYKDNLSTAAGKTY